MIWLLDTNTLAYAINGVPSVRSRINEAEERRDRIITSVIVQAELVFGAENSGRPQENRRTVKEKLSHLEVVPITPEIADRYGARFRRDARH